MNTAIGHGEAGGRALGKECPRARSEPWAAREGTATMDGRTFAIDLVRRSHEWAERYVAQEYGRIRARLQARGLIEYCRSLMWREYMIGVHVPAKTLA